MSGHKIGFKNPYAGFFFKDYLHFNIGPLIFHHSSIFIFYFILFCLSRQGMDCNNVGKDRVTGKWSERMWQADVVNVPANHWPKISFKMGSNYSTTVVPYHNWIQPLDPSMVTIVSWIQWLDPSVIWYNCSTIILSFKVYSILICG